MKRQIKRAAILLFVPLLGCGQRSWQGWVYPDRNNLPDDIPIGAYASLEECRASARNILERLDQRDEDGEKIIGDYECGYNCKPDGGGLNVCAKTER